MYDQPLLRYFDNKVGSFQKQKEKMVKTKKTVAERLFSFKNRKVDYERIVALPDKEYSVFGSPQQKIGNFTGQKKLGDFNA